MKKEKILVKQDVGGELITVLEGGRGYHGEARIGMMWQARIWRQARNGHSLS